MDDRETARRKPLQASGSSGQPTTTPAAVPGEFDGAATAALKDSLIGTVLDGRYQIVSLLGKGSWGAVYKATHIKLGNVVAIKVLHAHLADDQEKFGRFQREAKAACELRHPNVATVFDFGTSEQGQAYYVMDLLEGNSLAQVIEKDGRLEPLRAIHIFKQLSLGLSAAHKRGIVHRDIKPSNVVLTGAGANELAKLVDFGLAKILIDDAVESAHLTQTGDTLGTPAYMSPEQCQGQKIDARTDIYSLGVSMYEALTGKRPFSADSVFQAMFKQVSQIADPFSKALPDEPIDGFLEEVVFKCLEKVPAHRYQFADEIAEDLTTAEARTLSPGLHWQLDTLRRSWPALRRSLHRQRGALTWLAAIVLIGVLSATANFLIGHSVPAIQSDPGVYVPGPNSCISTIDYHGCPGGAQLAKQIATTCDANYRNIRQLLGLPQNWATERVSVTIGYNENDQDRAYTNHNTMEFNGWYLNRHPSDMGLVHYQFAVTFLYFPTAHQGDTIPAWIQPSLADYIRDHAVDKPASSWCAKCSEGEGVRNSSRCGAAFLRYATERFPQAQPVHAVVRALIDGTYNDDIWERTTGKSFESLRRDFLGSQHRT